MVRWGITGFAACALLAVVGPIGGASEASAASAQNPDDLLIVDCLLPGKVRKLGRRVTYVQARKGIKTSAVDCAIRGGEYTSFDRSNYATALKIWLPQAQAGDAEAQAYVGEIFEKGLGVEPQYDVAVAWYTKAAEQGLARAQLNLGALYEKGLGVPKDMAKAVELYRQASGLSGKAVQYVPAEVESELTELRAERERLGRERAALQRERDALRRQYESVSTELEATRRALTDRRGALEALEEDLAEARARLELERRAATKAGDDARAKALEADLAQNRERSKARDAEMQNLRRKVLSLRQKSSELKQSLALEAENREREVAQFRSEAERARAALTLITDQYKRLELDIARQREVAAIGDNETARLRSALQHERMSALRDEDVLRDLNERLRAREYKLAAERERIAEMSGQLSALKTKAEELESTAQSREKEKRQLAMAGPIITIIDPALQRTRDATGSPAAIVRSVGERLVIGKVESPDGVVALMVNDRENQVSPGGLFRAKVPIKFPETAVSIVAIDGKGRRRDMTFRLLPQADTKSAAAADDAPQLQVPEDVEFGNFVALIIGNNDYALLPKLQSAVGDARAVEEILRTRYGFKTKLVLNATRYQILSALNEMRETLSDADNLLIYYAGHGELDRINNRGHWLPVDAEPNSTANWISNIQITDVLNAMSAQQIMLVVDSCYSGTLTRAAVARLGGGMTDEARINWLKVMAEKRARVVLSSGGVQPVLDSGGGEHSVFAKAFLQALRDNRQVLEGQRLYQTVSAGVTSSSAAASVDQVPQYAPIKFAGHEAGDFFFVPRAN